MSKKLHPIERLWEAIDGSVYVVEADDVRMEFTKHTIKVKTAIAFNVGDAVARNIVETHNAMLLYKQIGIIPKV